MCLKSQAHAAAAGTHMECREGRMEDIPLPDASADVVISNGVLNLTPDKPGTLGEISRVLRPGGRLQIADILVTKPVPAEAKQRIDLWTG